MESIVGRVFGGLLVRGLQVFESMMPMPARLSDALLDSERPGRDADPVILITGFANSPSGWNEWKRSLEEDGFQVFVIRLSGVGLSDMNAAADELAAYVNEVRRRTGRKHVDLVGYSQGGLLSRMYIAQRGGAANVDRAISLATPHAGIAARQLHDLAKALPIIGEAVPVAATQLIEGSSLLVGLEQADRALRIDPIRRVRYASVFSQTIDGVVTPWAAQLDGATNLPVRGDQASSPGPNHYELLHLSDRAYEAVRLLLLDRPERDAWVAARAVDR